MSNINKHINPFKIIAHRGGISNYPENTIESFRQSIIDGASGFECDVRLSKDNEPIIIHTKYGSNEIIDKFDTNRKLSELTWKELQNIHLMGTNYHIPHLYDALQFAANSNVWCYLEPKENSYELMDKIIDGIIHYNLYDRCVILTFYSRRHLLSYVKKKNPKIKTNAIVVLPFLNWHSSIVKDKHDITLGYWFINHYKILSKMGISIGKMIHNYQQNGIEVLAGFADDSRNIRWFLEIGVNGVLTNNVHEAKALDLTPKNWTT